ncbi:hypothetical protein DITRI_Ditri18aG0128400 [Diplodiscus trichospermus]
MSSHMSYNRVGRRCRGSKGFRLNIPKRFSVKGLRARFFYLFRLLSRWRSSYGRGLRLIIRKMGMNGSSNIMINKSSGGSDSRSRLVTPKDVALPNSNRLRPSLGRSNSFYSEAIADCLEFIKRSSSSSSSVDQKQAVPVRLGGCQR